MYVMCCYVVLNGWDVIFLDDIVKNACIFWWGKVENVDYLCVIFKNEILRDVEKIWNYNVSFSTISKWLFLYQIVKNVCIFYEQ